MSASSTIFGVNVSNPAPIVVSIDQLKTVEVPVEVLIPHVDPGWTVTKTVASCPPHPSPCKVHFSGPVSWENQVRAIVTYTAPINLNSQDSQNWPIRLQNNSGQINLARQTYPQLGLDVRTHECGPLFTQFLLPFVFRISHRGAHDVPAYGVEMEYMQAIGCDRREFSFERKRAVDFNTDEVEQVKREEQSGEVFASAALQSPNESGFACELEDIFRACKINIRLAQGFLNAFSKFFLDVVSDVLRDRVADLDERPFYQSSRTNPRLGKRSLETQLKDG